MPRGIQIFMVFVAVVAFLSVGTFFHLTREVTAPSSIDIVTSSAQPQITAATTQEVVFGIVQVLTTTEYTLASVDKTITGISDQVAGEITLNLNDLSQSHIGELRIDMPINGQRNDTSAHSILYSETVTNPMVLFDTIAINGLSGSITVGDRVQFQATGNLTIAGVTQRETFTVTAHLQTEDQLTGHAETVISRTDFNLTGSHPSDSNGISDAITLKLDFIASAS